MVNDDRRLHEGMIQLAPGMGCHFAQYGFRHPARGCARFHEGPAGHDGRCPQDALPGKTAVHRDIGWVPMGHILLHML